MKKTVYVILIFFVFIFFSCSSGSSKKSDNETLDQNNHSDSDEIYDNDIVIDDNEITHDIDIIEETKDDDINDESDNDVAEIIDENSDEDVFNECSAPSEISEFNTKPYARMRIYMNPEEFPDDTNDDEYPDDDNYVEEIPQGIDYFFKSEYDSVKWESDSYEMTAIVIPEFDEDDNGFKDYLFIEGTEKTENENDVRWFIFMMETSVLKKMQADNINEKEIEENAMIFIKRDTETENMSKSCLEAILKKVTVYACHNEKSNYNIYEPLNLWFAIELETNEEKILLETEYDELCECSDANGDPVDCSTL